MLETLQAYVLVASLLLVNSSSDGLRGRMSLLSQRRVLSGTLLTFLVRTESLHSGFGVGLLLRVHVLIP